MADCFGRLPFQLQQLGRPSQPNFLVIQMRPFDHPFVLEHSDDNARGDALFIGEFPDGALAARRCRDEGLPSSRGNKSVRSLITGFQFDLCVDSIGFVDKMTRLL